MESLHPARAALAGISLGLLALAAGACSGDGSSPEAPDATRDAADATPGDAAVDPDADATGSDATAPCNPVAPSGCPDGEHCSWPEDADGPTCVTSGEVPFDEPCDDGTCAEGVCMSVGGPPLRCYRICDEDADCPDQRSCEFLTNRPFDVCEIEEAELSCDPVAQDCPDGQGCYLVAARDEPICLEAGEDEADASCQAANCCAPGLTCVDETCRPLCDPEGGEGSCEGEAACTPFRGAGYCDRG